MEIRISLTCPECGQTADDYTVTIDRVSVSTDASRGINIGGKIFCCPHCYSDFVVNILYKFTIEKLIRRIVPQYKEIDEGSYAARKDGTVYRQIKSEETSATRINTAEQAHIDGYLGISAKELGLPLFKAVAEESPREITDSGEVVVDLDTGFPVEVVGDYPDNSI